MGFDIPCIFLFKILKQKILICICKLDALRSIAHYQISSMDVCLSFSIQFHFVENSHKNKLVCYLSKENLTKNYNKCGTLHDFACHSFAWSMLNLNLLCYFTFKYFKYLKIIVPIPGIEPGPPG